MQIQKVAKRQVMLPHAQKHHWTKGLSLCLSLGVAILVWSLLAIAPATADSFPNLLKVAQSVGTMINKGVLFTDIGASLFSVGCGFALGFIIALPLAIVMAWYAPIERIIGPWIQFIRSIPPLAYVPLVVISAGIGAKAQIIVITLATSLVMTITIYQGVRNVDPIYIKAARVLGAKERDIFLHVVIPATTPYIITAVRLGATTALTTLIAAETTGASAGLGMRIQSLSQTFDTAPMMMYIILIGLIGIAIDHGIRLIERRVTQWQAK
ncbi:ABC transporter permease [Lacticaseibacillus jixiensis]|uniref:ABC transporter permease n=1 Tax=Lacticaseibacillus jixiensis TaxID=3231926 RepID=UPI0036F2A21F